MPFFLLGGRLLGSFLLRPLELGNRVLAISEKRAQKAAGKLARPRVVLCDLFDFASPLQHRSGTLPEKPLSSAGVSGCSFPLEQNLMSDDVASLCPFGLFGLLFFPEIPFLFLQVCTTQRLET